MNRSRIMRSSFLLLLIFAILSPGTAAAKTKSLELIIDEVTLTYNSQKPEIMDGVIMSPSVPVLKQMNAKYEWNSKNQTLTIEKDKSKLRLTIGSNKAVLNGKEIALGAKPRLIKGNIYIPVKSVVLAFGAEMEVRESSTSITLMISFTDYGKMVRALTNKDYNKVKNLINKGIDLKYVDKSGMNYLHIATHFSSVKIIRLLLENGVSANHLDKFDFTPLGIAILDSNVDVVKLLALYTDLSYVSPYTNYSYMDDAIREVELTKRMGNKDKLVRAEAIVAYLEETYGALSPGSSPKYPAGMGQTVTVNTISSFNNKKSIGITVEKVLRGNQAWRKVAEANSRNSSPKDDQEYIAVLVRIDLDHDSQQYIPANDHFNLSNDEGDGYIPPVMSSLPEPQFKIYFDDKKDTSSWLVYNVPKDIAMDKLILGYQGGNSKNLVYFQLKHTPENEKTVDLSQLQLPSNISSMPDVNELKSILEQNFNRLYVTTQGDMTFEFNIIYNDTTLFPYDYRVETLLDYSKFHNLLNGKSITVEQRELILQQLKDHQEKVGMTLTALYPNVKFIGEYHDSWYKYPYLRVGIESFSLYGWSNYDKPIMLTYSYNEAKPSFFRWVY